MLKNESTPKKARPQSKGNNFFKRLIRFHFPSISDLMGEQIVSMLIGEGYLDAMENYRYEIYCFYHEQIELNIDMGDDREEAERKAWMDTCELYKIHQSTLWRIRKHFDVCTAVQTENH